MNFFGLNYYMTFNCLSIAGIDPTGGAGVYTDLKVFSALGNYGTAVITALFIQNTQGVKSVYKIPEFVILEQLESIFSDVYIDSIKIGALFDSNIVKLISRYFKNNFFNIPIVLDTVFFSKNKFSLLSLNAIDIFIKYLFPVVSIITPNLEEAALLLKQPIAKDEDDMIFQGEKLLSFGVKAVLMKGGHLLGNQCVDWLFTKDKKFRYVSKKIDTKNTHGTGCTLSSSLAALYPYYKDWPDVVKKSKKYTFNSILNSNQLDVGKGSGPLNHFYNFWYLKK
ncbi:MAG: bifunctional hydroxymethylpyrimidine kinase/phosphomethylpyrimidine kinase [Arsenophonus sp.]|nr:MAG: bifunctional hydroxymethylpyrimidine kinase/phosphomethylpyrimidine kinase [Arsenophonus sp.]